MKSRLLAVIAATTVPTVVAPTPTSAQDAAAVPGEAVYEERCAACHEGGNERAPTLSTLRLRSSEDIRFSLTEGAMAAQGAALSAEQLDNVVAYLMAGAARGDAWIADISCGPERRAVDLSGVVAMRSAGVDLAATRRVSTEASGLTDEELAGLELKWALGIPDVAGLRGAPVIVGSTVYFPATQSGRLLALDAETGCVKWSYDAGSAVRSSPALGEIAGRMGPRQVLYFGDQQARVHAIDALTGARIWVASGRATEESGSISGSVIVHEGTVIVPISDGGIVAASNPQFECCVGRGAVTVLDATTGEKQWVYFTMEEADYTGEVSPTGVRMRGPSGAPIWSTPSIDVDRGRVYVTTGENTSAPATLTSDAIIALDLETGEELWVFQATQDDIWNMACTRQGPNCPDPDVSILEDWDFGGPAVPVSLPDGRDLVLAGQKSGQLWALNAEDGSLAWVQRVGEGSPRGGNHWGIAVGEDRAFLPISDPGTGPGLVPGMYAFDIATGEPLWEHRVTADCEDGRRELIPSCNTLYGLSATPLVVDGAVVAGATDGRIYAFDADSGEVLFQFDSARPFETINGVEARGGSIDSQAIGAGAGMVFVGSGYDFFGQQNGNVLLAFGPSGS